MGGCHAVKELCYGSHHFSTRHPPSISLFFVVVTVPSGGDCHHGFTRLQGELLNYE